MAGFLAAALAVLFRYAGGWGVPYFSWTTERGSNCRNDLTGYTCTPMTLADIEFFGDVDLPDDTGVLSSRYRSTHDYELQAYLVTPKARAAAALAGLTESFGECEKDRPSPLTETGLKKRCTIVNPDTDPETHEPTSRVYTVGTALRPNGDRVTQLNVRSR